MKFLCGFTPNLLIWDEEGISKRRIPACTWSYRVRAWRFEDRFFSREDPIFSSGPLWGLRGTASVGKIQSLGLVPFSATFNPRPPLKPGDINPSIRGKIAEYILVDIALFSPEQRLRKEWGGRVELGLAPTLTLGVNSFSHCVSMNLIFYLRESNSAATPFEGVEVGFIHWSSTLIIPNYSVLGYGVPLPGDRKIFCNDQRP